MNGQRAYDLGTVGVETDLLNVYTQCTRARSPLSRKHSNSLTCFYQSGIFRVDNKETPPFKL